MQQNNEILVTRQDFESYKEICSNTDESKKLLPHALAAQMFDIKPVIGDSFYYDVIKNQHEENYRKLINGEVYENQRGEEVLFKGLKLAIIYYSHARYVMDKDVNDTPFGMRHKTSEFSERVSDKRIDKMQNQSRAMGLSSLSDVQKYLSAKKDVFPLYRKCSTGNKKQVYKIKGAGK